jgi:DNA repair photolyase
VTLGGSRNSLPDQIRELLRKEFEKDFEGVLRKRSELLQELFEVGVKTRANLNPPQPMGLRAEQVRKEMEDLASRLEAQLPTLLRKHEKTRQRLKGLATMRNHLSARFTQLERMQRGKDPNS